MGGTLPVRSYRITNAVQTVMRSEDYHRRNKRFGLWKPIGETRTRVMIDQKKRPVDQGVVGRCCQRCVTRESLTMTRGNRRPDTLSPRVPETPSFVKWYEAFS